MSLKNLKGFLRSLLKISALFICIFLIGSTSILATANSKIENKLNRTNLKPSFKATKLPDSYIYSNGETTSRTPPSIQFFKNRLYQVHRGTDSRIYYNSCDVSRQQDDVTCSNWKFANGETNEAVTMTVFKDKLYMSHVGRDSKIWLRNSSDGENWNNWEEVGGNTEKPIVMSVFRDRLYQVHRGNNKLIYTRCSQNGEIWTDWNRISDGSTAKAISNYEDGASDLLQFHRGDDRRIYFRFYPKPDWLRFADDIFTDQPVFATATRTPTPTIALSYLAPDGHLYFTIEYLEV